MLCRSCGAFVPLHTPCCTHCGTQVSAVSPAIPVALTSNPAPGRCTVPGCQAPISKPGHTLCYTHWKATTRPSPPAPAPQPQADSLLTATALGETLNLSSRKEVARRFDGLRLP